jgi:hypothetical protein
LETGTPGGSEQRRSREHEIAERKRESVSRKKNGTNVKAVRAGRPVTQTTPGLKGLNPPPQPE